VFDAVPDRVPGSKVKISSKISCDVCMKKNKNVSAVIYCGSCDKKFCSQHKQVCQTHLCTQIVYENLQISGLKFLVICSGIQTLL